MELARRCLDSTAVGVRALFARGAAPLLALSACVLWAVALSACSDTKAPVADGRYVALGDSNTSGAGLPTPDTGAPKNCYRTQSGYPTVAAKSLGRADFQTTACSGAGIESLTNSQALYPEGQAPPQIYALNGKEALVSVTIGDNDAGFGEVTKTCLNATSPSATPCRDKYVTSTGNRLVAAAAALAGPLGDALDEIHRQAPDAKVFIVGYGPIIPRDGEGCWGKVDVSAADAPVFYGWQEAITKTEKATAAAHDATYVDFFHSGAGHDACKSAKLRWTNPVQGVPSPEWPLHPTVAGANAAAALLVKTIRQSDVG